MNAIPDTKSFKVDIDEILNDFKIGYLSRYASQIGRSEVLNGKAKFGIFGDGKELPQLALAKVFRNGDFRSGYYRDQTFMMAIGELTLSNFFAQLYGHADINFDPASGGRMMNCHFGTRLVNDKGNWLDLTKRKNSSSDVSCNAAQMPRLLGLAYASKLYRNNKHLNKINNFSIDGNEIAYGTIGNAATSEGMFFETINAAAVLQVPMVLSVWDDHYGISVTNDLHTAKQSISEALKGFEANNNQNDGIRIFKVNGWEYDKLIQTYLEAEAISRNHHIPCVIHVTDLTQPLGHSTSGSHERYKSEERLAWEKEYDCLAKFEQWITENGYYDKNYLESLKQECFEEVINQRDKAWRAYKDVTKEDALTLSKILEKYELTELADIKSSLRKNSLRKMDIINLSIESKEVIQQSLNIEPRELKAWLQKKKNQYQSDYSSNLYSETSQSATLVSEVLPQYDMEEIVDGREVMKRGFDEILHRDPRVFIIGQDIGKLGGVNQCLSGLQEKYGSLRVTDTGIRECTQVGQGIGAALRGLKPIIEIQYLDYLPYALQILSDDLSTLRYRTSGGQKAPVIIRTRGHRLEGIWHSGSYMAAIINAVRGMYVLVPRNMTQAMGFYNTMIESDDSAIIVERLNAYRLKEKLPSNITEIKTPIGVVEILRNGKDITLVTYGAMCDIVLEACDYLSKRNISCEVIDVRSLIPFDRTKIILKSIHKTGKVIFIDEDVPGGTTAYMMQNIIDRDNGFDYLDHKPITISSKEHRPAYGDDGDYFSKPNKNDIIDAVLEVFGN